MRRHDIFEMNTIKENLAELERCYSDLQQLEIIKGNSCIEIHGIKFKDEFKEIIILVMEDIINTKVKEQEELLANFTRIDDSFECNNCKKIFRINIIKGEMFEHLICPFCGLSDVLKKQ